MKDLLQYPTDYWSKIEQNIISKLKKQKQTIVYSHSSSLVLVAHWLSVSGDWGSNPCREEKNSWFVFESQSHDCPI